MTRRAFRAWSRLVALVVLWWVGICPCSASQGARYVIEPYCDGQHIRARVQLDVVAAGSDLELILDGTQKRATVQPAVAGGVTTLLTFDGSGSFQRHHDRAFDLAEGYVDARLAEESIGVMVFGRSARTWTPASATDAVRANLAEARALGAVQQETRLAAFVREAVEQVTRAQPVGTGGVRRVVVFTDAGEESRVFDVDEVVDYARNQQVIVDAIVFARSGARSYAEDLDRLARLAHLTGGDVIEIHGDEAPRDDVRALAGRATQLIDVSALYCGSAPPQVTVQGPNGVQTATQVAAGQPVACRDGEGPGTLPDDPVVDPAAQGSAPVSAPRPTSSGQTSPLPSGPPGKLAGLLCLILALAVLAALGGAAYLLASRNDGAPRDEGPVVPPAEPPPQEPVAPTPPENGSPDSGDVPAMADPSPKTENDAFSMHLPETHLRVLQGDLPPGTRWRFAGRILRVGANEEDNDVVVDLPQISGRHARFELFPSGAVFLEDLGSSNGSWVGPDRLRPGVRVEVPPGTPVALSSQLILVIEQPHRRADPASGGKR
jgi:hypothetical protein